MSAVPEASGAPDSTLHTETLAVEGMTCAACATRIEKVLRRVDGVEEANVNLATERAQVRFDHDRVAPEAITAAIEKAGFTVPPKTARLRIRGMTCSSCTDRVEAALRKGHGVITAQVNGATEVATVAYRAGVIDEARLIEAVNKAGYEAEPAPRSEDEAAREQDRERSLRRRELGWLLTAAILSAPLLLPMLVMPFGLDCMPAGWIQFLLATPVQFLVGARFYRGAYASLRSKTANMDVLVALGTSAAYALSVYHLFGNGIAAAFTTAGDHASMQHLPLYFESSAVVITLVLVGKTLEGRAKRSTNEALRALAALVPTTARVVRDGVVIEVAAEAVGRGEIVVVRPGERVPVDGIIREGHSSLDEAHLTGESLPQERDEGDDVAQGAINGAGALRVEATAVGAESTLNQVIALVEDAQANKPAIQKTVDQVSAIFVPAVLAIAFVTLGAWVLSGAEWSTAILHAVSVLVIACPCALGLATPAALVVGTGAAAKAGILVRDVDALEKARSLAIVLFDKTGTLTEGAPRVRSIALSAAPNTADAGATKAAEDALLALVAAAEQDSEHPLAKAVLHEAKTRGLPLETATDVQAIAGRGLQARVGAISIFVGNRAFVDDKRTASAPDANSPDALLDATARAALEQQVQAQEERGETGLWIATALDDNPVQIQGVLLVGDPPRPSSAYAVQRLGAMGIEVGMLSGDNQRTANAVASTLGISAVVAEVLPADKAAHVEAMREAISKRVVKRRGGVAMVGDGINDAPALAAADVSVAMATGSDVARQTAALTLMRPQPELVADAIELSIATTRKIRQNLFWAFAFNTLGIPLAAFGLLSPVLAGGAMALSSVTVVTNALLLKRWRPHAFNLKSG